MKWTLLLGVAAVALLILAPMTMAADHAKARGGTYGEVTAVGVADGKVTSITVKSKGREEGAVAVEKVIKVDEKTKVQVMEKAAEGEKPAPKDGKIEDVKVGVRVGVKMTEEKDSTTAAVITILPKRAEKKAE